MCISPRWISFDCARAGVCGKSEACALPPLRMTDFWRVANATARRVARCSRAMARNPGSCRALSGLGSGGEDPGRCPGLSYFAPLGLLGLARNEISRRARGIPHLLRRAVRLGTRNGFARRTEEGRRSRRRTLTELTELRRRGVGESLAARDHKGHKREQWSCGDRGVPKRTFHFIGAGSVNWEPGEMA
jgi:hypothetical protein